MSESEDQGTTKRYTSFASFYPFYLSEHSNRSCRRLHFVGTSLVIATVLYAVTTGTWAAFALAPLFGYGFAWVGHFGFEKNRPATFEYPLYSFIGDFAMYRDILTRKIDF